MIDGEPASRLRWFSPLNLSLSFFVVAAPTFVEGGFGLFSETGLEKAARGTDGRTYPWGNVEPDPERGVYRRTWGHEAMGAVGTHPAGASPYGLLDMAGNVWEWCSDWYDGDYYAVSPYRDPKGPPSGRVHVVRGGGLLGQPPLGPQCFL